MEERNEKDISDATRSRREVCVRVAKGGPKKDLCFMRSLLGGDAKYTSSCCFLPSVFFSKVPSYETFNTTSTNSLRTSIQAKRKKTR